MYAAGVLEDIKATDSRNMYVKDTTSKEQMLRKSFSGHLR